MPQRTAIHCRDCSNLSCFVKKCSEEGLNRMNAMKTQMLYRKGQLVFQEGSRVFGAWFIQSGSAKVQSSSLMGKEQIVRLACAGHMLGHMGYGAEVYPIGALTLEDSRICFFDNDTLYKAFMSQPDFTFNVMMFYSRELRKSELRAKCFAQMTTDEKVCYALIYATETLCIPEEELLTVALSRQEVAEIAGTNAEQVSRTVSSLKSDNLISLIGKTVIVRDIEALKNKLARYNIPV